MKWIIQKRTTYEKDADDDENKNLDIADSRSLTTEDES